MQSQSSKPDFWLEPLDEKHLQDFHELCSDEQAAFWSSQRSTATLEATAVRLTQAFAKDIGKPWLVSCAIMSSNHPPQGAHDATPATATSKMIGVVRTTRASPWGLMIGYKLRSDCWGRGYATRAVCAFLDIYWSQPRRAPRGETLVQQALDNHEARSGLSRDETSTRDGNTMTRVVGFGGDADEVEITHLVAQVDPDNLGSIRVAEKCGGKLVTVAKESVKVWRFPEKRDMAVWRLDKPSASAESG
ncbi:GNAT domain-containing protein [Colletotrichum navitas]|uniref:GNAT domain-containing protein n=1 Tax=Colletotrichum navitas TaxID=681940 RepID=A0AAD8Q163_9PEZI|nr:GNAT domain-containing protein [Colletotrichum navitas]KAK1590877.1 GNAT domain-containing protein [Colletotrichum navitas]